jgi:prepilin peptidase CpaA
VPHAAHVIDWIAILVLTAALIAAAISDAATFLIPNRYPAAIIAAYVAYAFGKPAPFWLQGAAVGVAFLAVGALLFDRGVLGGGDVKLLAASALWAGLDQLTLLLVVTGIGSGVLALALLSPLHRLMPARAGGPPGGDDLRSKLGRPIPFGIAIAAAGMGVAITRFLRPDLGS